MDVDSEISSNSEDQDKVQQKTLDNKYKATKSVLTKDLAVRETPKAKIINKNDPKEFNNMPLSSSMDKLSLIPNTIYQVGNTCEKMNQQLDKLACESYDSFKSVLCFYM